MMDTKSATGVRVERVRTGWIGGFTEHDNTGVTVRQVLSMDGGGGDSGKVISDQTATRPVRGSDQGSVITDQAEVRETRRPCRAVGAQFG